MEFVHARTSGDFLEAITSFEGLQEFRLTIHVSFFLKRGWIIRDMLQVKHHGQLGII